MNLFIQSCFGLSNLRIILVVQKCNRACAQQNFSCLKHKIADKKKTHIYRVMLQRELLVVALLLCHDLCLQTLDSGPASTQNPLHTHFK